MIVKLAGMGVDYGLVEKERHRNYMYYRSIWKIFQNGSKYAMGTFRDFLFEVFLILNMTNVRFKILIRVGITVVIGISFLMAVI